MEENFKYLWQIMITGAIAIIGFFGTRTFSKLDDIEKDTRKNANDLHEHKTHVASNFPTNNTIERVHSRIDALGDKIDKQTSQILDAIINNNKQ